MSASKPYNSNKGCEPGYHHRKGYHSPTGRYVEPRCVRATTVYPQTSQEFKASLSKTQKAKLKNVRGKLGLTKRCPPGKLLRAPYRRTFSSTVRREGFNRKRAGKTVRIYPKAHSVLVKAACIEDRGLPGTLKPGEEGIAPLRKGELSRYGYKIQLSTEERHMALRKAIAALTALNVYHKLDAVAKLTKRTAPEASRIFRADRQWVQKNFSLKANFNKTAKARRN